MNSYVMVSFAISALLYLISAVKLAKPTRLLHRGVINELAMDICSVPMLLDSKGSKKNLSYTTH